MKAVILAGGRGTRLAPYTRIFPKPMMPIGDKTILEIVLLQLKHFGITDIVLTIGHLSGLMRAFFQDGKQFGVNIEYSFEEEPLGTAGPLKMIKDLDETFIVLNGDVLTNLDINKMVDFHKINDSVATISMHEYQVFIDLGIINHDLENHIIGYIEKPTLEYNVSMGIYIFEPEVLDFIPKQEYYDFPELVKNLIAHNLNVIGYPFNGYWKDLGRTIDYEQACNDFENMRSTFLDEVH
jgi:NDP-sugar pyrophosphorylase family protein